MTKWPDDLRSRRDGVTIPTIWVAIALSLLIHTAVLWQWLPKIRLPSLEEPKLVHPAPLAVRLAPPPGPPPAPPPSPAPQARPPPVQARPPKAVRLPRPPPRPPPPPVIALNRPAPDIPPPTPAVPAAIAPAPARAPAGDDLTSYIEAQRRARADSAPTASPNSASNALPAEDDVARTNRIVAANLAPQRPPTFGYDPTRSGGVFEIKRIGYNDAEFMFYGWNIEVRRNTAQLIEVSKGSNSDIRIAVVRKMIAIIRDNVQGDFLWESQRLGRSLTMSARLKDNAGLEEFMMREFFYDQRLPR